MLRSAASVFVGRPVEGPPRWMSTINSGSSRLTARLMVSPLSDTSGPLVGVTPRWPAKAAPSAEPMADISSSAWNVRTPKFLRFDNSCKMSEAGVMGYDPRNTGRLASCPAATKPHDRAVLPETFVYSPGSCLAGSTWNGWWNNSVVSPKFTPALNAARFDARTWSFLANRSLIHCSVPSTGREYSHEMRPSAKKFLDRSASRGLTPRLAVACWVSEVIGTSTSLNDSRLPSVSG